MTTDPLTALRTTVARLTEDDLMALEAVIVGLEGGCTCEECKVVREALDRIGAVVEAAQALVER